MDDVVILVDVDNTLLDNDGVIEDLRAHLEQEFGKTKADRYWVFFEELRDELGYADYLGALQRYRIRELQDEMNDPRLLQMSNYLIDYPFSDRLYPDALRTVEHLKRLGKTVVLTDGDVVFQPRKVQRSGIWDAVDGDVLIYIHKELMLDAVRLRYPARHYVMVDDKLRILTAMKQTWGKGLTTVFPQQGHYAKDMESNAKFPAADVTVECIGDLLKFDLHALTCGVNSQSEQ